MFSFYNKRYLFFAISAVVILIGIIGIFVNGVVLDIQFKGGSILSYTFDGDIDISKAEDTVKNSIGRVVTCQETTDLATQHKKLVINIADNKGLSAQDQERMDEDLKAAFPGGGLALSESSIVEPFIGKRFLQKGIMAVVIAFVLMIIYVWFSFRKIGGLSAGVTALIALLHDVVFVFLAFVLFKIPINELFVACALTIIGYSINDTIIIYDRARENKQLKGDKLTTTEIFDLSANQSFTRSINTSLTTLLSFLVVFIFAQIYGITSIRNFALPMMFGIVAGCYSSLCIAGPLWVMWQNFRDKRRAAAKA